MDPFVKQLVKLEKVDADARKAVDEMVLHFAIAGGRPTLKEWFSMDAETRRAFMDAAAQVEERRSQLVGDAVLIALKAHYGSSIEVEP